MVPGDEMETRVLKVNEGEMTYCEVGRTIKVDGLKCVIIQVNRATLEMTVEYREPRYLNFNVELCRYDNINKKYHPEVSGIAGTVFAPWEKE
jgi:hypothetical protein